jgi:hypothetical protein
MKVEVDGGEGGTVFESESSGGRDVGALEAEFWVWTG